MQNGTYREAKAVLGLVQILGWIALIAAIVLTAWALSDARAAPVAWTVGLGLALGALVQIAVAQIGTAVIGTAENSAAILDELRRGAAPRLRGTGPATPSAPSAAGPVRRVERYRAREITATPFGFEVDGKRYDSLQAAQRAIDKALG